MKRAIAAVGEFLRRADMLLFGLCVAYLVDASFNPFLYFRF